MHPVGIGPPTNIGAALRRDPILAHCLTGLTMMGGVFDRADHSPAQRRAIQAIQACDETIWPDHNTASDAEAALVSAQSGCPVAWVTSEVTMRVPLRRRHLDRLSLERPLGQVLRGWPVSGATGVFSAPCRLATSAWTCPKTPSGTCTIR